MLSVLKVIKTIKSENEREIEFVYGIVYEKYLARLDWLVAVGFNATLKSQKRPTRKMFVYKIQVNPIHTILKDGDYYDFMDK